MATVPSIEQDEPTVSVFQSDLPIDEKLDRARTELLDLSARNRLLNMPRAAKGAKAVEVVDEISSEIFRMLVGEARPFSFLAGKAAPAGEQTGEDVPAEESDEIADLAQPEDDVADERGVYSRHVDTRLQTRLTPTRPSHLFGELHETPRGALSMLAEEVVRIEGPVHACEVINRIRDAWGLKRAGPRIQEAVEAAIAVSVREGRITDKDDFLDLPSRTPKVRDRSTVRSASLRKSDTLPPAELEIAILDVVRINYGATDDQVMQAAARAVGFKSTSSQLRDLLADVIAAAIKGERLARQSGMLVLGSAASGE